MKICVISDIHVEFYDEISLLELIPTEGYDLLLLLGDISENPDFIHKICKKINLPIIYVLGNHEFYSPLNKGFNYIEYSYKNLENVYENLTVFTSKANWKDFGNYRFFGGTNWPYISPSNELMIYNGINDFRTGNVTINNCNSSKILFDKDLKVLTQTKKILIGLSHFIPETFCSHPRFINSEFNVYFVSPIEYNIFSKCRYWFFGHGHDPININKEGCNFISNPLGYPFEKNHSWEPLILDI